MFVRDWMSSPAVPIPPFVTLPAALEFMDKHNVRRLPVVEPAGLAGIVTKSDILAKLAPRGARERLAQPVGEIMTRDVVTVAPDETIEGAAQIMLRKKISGLPVVEGGRLVGIITESDLFRAFGEIMGIRERGARIVLSVRDDEDLLHVLKQRLDGLMLRSLVTYHNAEASRWEVVLRVRGRVPARAR